METSCFDFYDLYKEKVIFNNSDRREEKIQ